VAKRRTEQVRLFTEEAGVMIKLLKLAALGALMVTALSGCNTFHGFGEDVSHLGGAISRAAK